MNLKALAALTAALALAACDDGDRGLDQTGPRPELPEPRQSLIPPMNIAWPVAWEDDKPTVPAGFTITAFATALKIPRQLLVLPTGDVLVAVGSGGDGARRRREHDN